MEENHWSLLLCNDGATKLLVKLTSSNADLSYEIILCDLGNIWKESATSEIIKNRCKLLNRRLEAPALSIIKHLRGSVIHNTGNSFTTIADESNKSLKLNIKNTFPGGIPFTWEFSCTLLNNKEALNHFSSPFLKLTASLLCKTKELEAIIKKKDEEIRDYKESGSKVSRPYLETEEFDQEKFHQNLRESSGYCQAVTKDIYSVASDVSINRLLSEVENDSKSPEVILIASPGGSHPKAIVARDGLVASKARNKLKRRGRCPPKGAEVISDSDSESNDVTKNNDDHKTSPKRINITQGQKKKKSSVKRKNKLF